MTQLDGKPSATTPEGSAIERLDARGNVLEPKESQEE
jgi:hypothetical protein